MRRKSRAGNTGGGPGGAGVPRGPGRKIGLLVAAVGATAALVAPQVGAAASGDVQCTGAFSGTARDLIVPPGAVCMVDGAQIRHDLIVERDGQAAIQNTTIGHDLLGRRAAQIETGFGATGPPGPVSVGHDVTISGSDSPNGLGYDICDTTARHDLRVTETNVAFEIEIGDRGTPQEFCSAAASPPDHVGHDLVVAGNTVGRIDVGNNTVGHDLVVRDNTASTDIDVSDNQVEKQAICTGNTPPPSKDGDGDGPNQARDNDGCG